MKIQHLVEQEIVSPEVTAVSCPECSYRAEVRSVNIPHVVCAACGFKVSVDPMEPETLLHCPECGQPTLEYVNLSDTSFTVFDKGETHDDPADRVIHPFMGGVFNVPMGYACPIHKS